MESGEDLMFRTLYAFANGDEAEAAKLVENEWADYTLIDVLCALAELCLNLSVITKLTNMQGHVLIVNRTTGDDNIDHAPPGLRTGARMVLAGLNEDALAVGDLVSAFIEETHADEEFASKQTALLFQAVFAAAGCLVSATADNVLAIELPDGTQN